MRLHERFEIDCSRDDAVGRLCEEKTLLGLLGEADTEIVERQGDTVTTRTRYRALGQEGDVTFVFHFLLDGNVRFEKVCDGRVWRELVGTVEIEERGDDRCEVEIELNGRTKALVPELTIRVPMQDQMKQMTRELKQRLGAG